MLVAASNVKICSGPCNRKKKKQQQQQQLKDTESVGRWAISFLYVKIATDNRNSTINTGIFLSNVIHRYVYQKGKGK